MPSYDSAWKEALYHHLRLLLLLLFPRLAARIDWTRDHQPLEQELRKLSPEGEAGTRFADALVRVRLVSGDERVLHAEVQGKKDDEFPRRVYVYNYRAFDLCLVQPESLVILADDDPEWMPTEFAIDRDYSALKFAFQPIKLVTEWGGRRAEFKAHENPMGLFVLAHLEARRTEGDEAERAAVKLDLLLTVTVRKLEPDDERLFSRYFDWLLPLPPEANRAIYEQARARAKEQGMEFMSYPEQLGYDRGQTAGLLRALELGLKLKFGAEGVALVPQIRRIEDLARLDALVDQLETATVLDDVRKLLD